MPKFNATFAANLRAYATVQVEAADEEAAHARFKEIADAMAYGQWPKDDVPELKYIAFNPEYDTLDNFEYLEDCGIDTLAQDLDA